MFRTWVPKEIVGVRIPKKVRKAAGRLSKPSRPMALTAIGSAIAMGLFAGFRWNRHHSG